MSEVVRLMTTRSIDLLNIWLMLLSCLLAFLFPFQLFLFSFAVLGPLHYFTEIPWLRGKKFFTTGKYDAALLLVLCVLIAVLHYSLPINQAQTQTTQTLIGSFGFVAFASALALTTIQKMSYKLIALLIIGVSAILFSGFSIMLVLFANLIPTIVHVYIFTGAFILYGALRHKSKTGIASLAVFAGCTLAIFLITPDAQSDRSLSYYVQSSYLFFAGLNIDLLNILGMARTTPDTPGLADVVFTSNVGIIIMRLIAFSYTYHFLNWFSKTSIIKWHQVPKRSLVIIGLLWVASLVLYAVDYKLGLEYLYALSLLHVVLEYPLNHRTFIGIGQEVRGLVSGKRVVA